MFNKLSATLLIIAGLSGGVLYLYNSFTSEIELLESKLVASESELINAKVLTANRELLVLQLESSLAEMLDTIAVQNSSINTFKEDMLEARVELTKTLANQKPIIIMPKKELETPNDSTCDKITKLIGGLRYEEL